MREVRGIEAETRAALRSQQWSWDFPTEQLAFLESELEKTQGQSDEVSFDLVQSLVVQDVEVTQCMNSKPTTSSEANLPEGNGQCCNGISCSFVIGTVVFGWLGFRFFAAYEFPFNVLGVVVGAILGMLTAPVLFFVFALVVQVVIKIEDFFRPPKP